MAGPRAPIGTLSQHAAAAAGLVRGMVPKMFTRTDPKQARKADEISESDSDSASDSDSSTDSDKETDEAVKEDTKKWADKLKAKKASQAPASASKSTKTEPASTTSPSAKNRSRAIKTDSKKSPSDSSASESESESDDSSDNEDDKMSVDPKPDLDAKKKYTKNGSAAVKNEDDSGSDSESSDEEMVDSTSIKKASTTSSSEASASEDESGDESSAPAANSLSKKGATLKTASSDDESGSESESESESEDESDSGSERDEETEPSQNTKSKPATSSTKEPVPVKPAKSSTAINGVQRSKEMVSESDSSSDAESANDSDGEDKAGSGTVEKRSGKNSVQAPQEIVSQGFHLRKAEEDVDAAAVARAFKKAKAEGKQVWYFTTPKSVPIEVIQKHAIPLEKVHAGQSIFAFEGAEYTAHFEEPVNHAIKVLIPGKTGNKYETVDHSVDRVLHITRVTRLGEKSEDEPASATTSASSPAIVAQAPRPQPKGLKARYQPFGVTNASSSNVGMDVSDDEDVEMSQAPALNAKSDMPKAAKKRKHGDVEKAANKEEPTSTPVKKPKKARVDTSSTKAAKESDIAPPPLSSSSSPTKKKSKGKEKTKKDTGSAETLTGDSRKPSKVTPVLPPAVPGVKSP
ncbi:DNA-directed RNA polymerase I subunit RPA34.5-domain-containing protein [Corynascus similis CBS 632.67]